MKKNIEVKLVTFAAHSDYKQTKDFISEIKPANIVLVHGNKKQTEKLKEKLKFEFKDIFVHEIFNPQNCQKLEFCLNANRVSNMIGLLSENLNKFTRYKQISDGIEVEENNVGLNLVTDEEDYYEFTGLIAEPDNIIIDYKDIEEFSQIKINKFSQRLNITYNQCINTILYAIAEYFESFENTENNWFLISSKIKMQINPKNIVLEWITNPYNDSIADSLALLIYQIENNPNSDLFKHYMSHQSYCSYKIKYICKMLKNKFGEVKEKDNKIFIRQGNKEEYIVLQLDSSSMSFENSNENNISDDLREKIKIELNKLINF